MLRYRQKTTTHLSSPLGSSAWRKSSSIHKRRFAQTHDHTMQTRPHLIQAGFFYIVLILLLVFVPPAKIANFPLTQAFLLFHWVFFMANTNFLAVLLGKLLPATVIGLSIQTLLFFKLQGVALTWQVSASLMLIAGLIMTLGLYNKHKIHA